MKLSKLKIENFRAVESMCHSLGDQTTYIGYNGSGKSSILLAINWLICGGEIQEKDFYAKSESSVPASELSVEGTFTDLTDSDRATFGKYSRGETMTVKRIARKNGEQKLVGNARYHKEIGEAIENNSFAEAKRLIGQIVERDSLSFPEDWRKLKKADLLEFISRWEEDPANDQYLDTVEAEDLSNFFGFAGTSILQSQSGFAFVPAAPDLSQQFSTEAKDSATSTLLGSLVKDTARSSVEKWKIDHSEALAALNTTVKDSSNAELKSLSKNVTSQLTTYLPNLDFSLEMKTDEWVPKITPYVEARISTNGNSFALDTQGHGIQRASLIALLQAVAESRAQQGENDSESSLIVVIEEPEVYQHPVQARQLATKLKQAVSGRQMQVIVATHSPFFISPEHLDSTYRVSSSPQGSLLSGGNTVGNFGNEVQSGRAAKWFRKTIPEGLFSRACLVLEGDTDQFVFEHLEVDGLSLADQGISVLNAEGALNLWTVVSLIESYGVPCYVLRDGDSDRNKALRKKNGNQTAADQTINSWRSQVEEFVKKGSELGHAEGFENYEWGEGCSVGPKMAILGDDLEAALASWTSFMNHCPLSSAEELRTAKHAGAYTASLIEASTEDCPPEIIDVFLNVVRLANNSSL